MPRTPRDVGHVVRPISRPSGSPTLTTRSPTGSPPPSISEEVDGTRNRPSPNISTSIHRPIKLGPPVYLP
jgi:hypothetical protein